MVNFNSFLKRNSPTILTCIGAAGVIATTVTAVRATPKALQLIEEAEAEKGEKLTKLEIVQVASMPYIPAAVIGLSTIACIFGANVLSSRNQASIMSAYALLDQSYKEYRSKVNDIYGEDADLTVKSEVAKDVHERSDVLLSESDEDLLFFDMNSLQYFNAPMNEILEKTTLADGMECWILTTPDWLNPIIDYDKF